jgi:hypothetical protein
MENDCLEKVPLFTPAKPHLNNDVLYRNHLCPAYDKCLSKAARENLLLDCGCCPYRGERRPLEVLDYFEVYACKALLRAIFFNR